MTINYTSFVNNGTQTATTTTTEKVSVAAISGPSEISAGELATYTITAYNGEPTEEDKKKIFWSVYIDGKRNHRIRIAKNIEKKIADDSKTDIYTDKNKRNSDLIIYALITPSEDKLEIKFSKWLDGRPNIKVEAHSGLNSFDKSCQQETKVKAKPEITSINWVNAKEQKITYAGYDQDVFLSIKTLGLKDKELNLDIFDYDETNEDDKLNWGNNTISITSRKVLKQFPIKKRSEYDLPQKDERTPALELYVVPYSSEPLENCKDKYATYLNLTPNEKIITGYFAEERKREAQKGEEEKPKEQPKPQVEPTPKVHTVVSGDTMYKVAKKYGVESYKVLRKYNNLKSNSLSVGQKLKIPPKKAVEKPKEEEKDTKTITYYQKIDTTSLGSEVHLIAETQNLEGKTVTFTLFEKEPILLTEKDQPLPFLVGEEEKTKVEATVNDGKAQVKIQLRKKEDNAYQEWKDILSPPDEPLKDIWYDAINDQHVHMTKEEKDSLELTSSIFFITPSVQYIPAVVKHEKKNTYLWLQVSCEGEQLDFDEQMKLTPRLRREGFDIEKAVAALNKNAKSSSIGYCARYVRWALEAGGMKTAGRPNSAKDYDTFLTQKSFNTVSSNAYTPIKGDIVVIEAFEGTRKNHIHGHIQMYNGEQWVSDFKQRGFWPGSDYRESKPKYTILRW